MNARPTANGHQHKIYFESFTKKFDQLLVLNNITFGIEEGEFLVVVGPTGCGKTTLVKLLIGLLKPTEGTIFINGRNTSQYAVQENLSIVFQEDSLLPWRTVERNIRLAMEVKGYPKDRIAQRCEEMLELLDLRKYRSFMPSQMSKGMRQRTAIARAYSTSPSIIVMDEPFGHFDARSREHIERMIVDVWQKTRATILFVTHNIEEAVFLGSRIIVLSQKPTSIKEVIPIDLPHPRSFKDERFVEIRQRVTNLIKWW